jgi:Tfp pilus assembly protein PilZ
MPCRYGNDRFVAGGVILDLSDGGVAISESLNLPRIGEEIVTTFRPRLENLPLRGRVIYVLEKKESPRLARFGVQFTEDSQQVRDKLEPYF